jgi:hypothetical protein
MEPTTLAEVVQQTIEIFGQKEDVLLVQDINKAFKGMQHEYDEFKVDAKKLIQGSPSSVCLLLCDECIVDLCCLVAFSGGCGMSRSAR